jgi:ABC-type multidrug transport system fused ATPase/permease subunit
MKIFPAATQTWQILNKTQRRQAAFLLFLMIVGMGMETLSIGLIVPVMTLLAQAPSGNGLERYIRSLTVDASPSQFVLVGIAVLATVYMAKTAFLAYQSWSQSKFIFDVQAELSERLLRIYLGQPYIFHLERNSAQLLRNITAEVSQYGINAVGPLLSLMAELLVLLGLATLLLYIEPIGAMVVISVLGVAGALFFIVIRSRATAWGSQRQIHEGLRIQHLQQSLGAAKEVLLLGCSEEFLKRYSYSGWLSAKVGHFQHALQLLPRLWLELLGVLGLCGLVLVMVLQGKTLQSIVPTLAVFATSAFRLIPSVNRVLGALQSLRYAGPAVSLLLHELKLKSRIEKLVSKTVSKGGERRESEFNSEFSLDHVHYAYPGSNQESLVEVSLSVKKGETVGIMGPSGAGKSTLVDIIIGLLVPTYGSLRIDGEDIENHIRTWQSRIGYVPQSIYLTDDTLRANVAFGLPPEAIDEERVRAALRSAQLEEFATSLPLGYETIVGERGVKLSGGQRQRIGIARALYNNPDVLVLDEATSALDTATEAELMKSVSILKGLKTIVIVAHRFATVQDCDRIYCLEKGEIVRTCTPEELNEQSVNTIGCTS